MAVQRRRTPLVKSCKDGATAVWYMKSPFTRAFLFKIPGEFMSQNQEKPFSMGYVLRTTARHMRKSIDVSIRKTFARMPEFQNDEAKSQEIFKTLGRLHALRNEIDRFQQENAEDFRGA